MPGGTSRASLREIAKCMKRTRRQKMILGREMERESNRKLCCLLLIACGSWMIRVIKKACIRIFKGVVFSPKTVTASLLLRGSFLGLRSSSASGLPTTFLSPLCISSSPSPSRSPSLSISSLASFLSQSLSPKTMHK